MWNIKQWFKDRNGFTLMELICGICIGSILLGICFSLLTFSSKSNAHGDKIDDLLYNGNYSLEYMKNEIQNADKIISSDKIKDLNTLRPNNIGFVIMEYQPNYINHLKYVYITYIIEDNKLFRLARRFDREVELVGNALTQKNEICEYISCLDDTFIDWDNKILFLNLNIGDKSMEDSFKSTILLNCSLDN